MTGKEATSAGSSGTAGNNLPCGPLRCDSPLDNNCNGTADDLEAPCKSCVLGTSVACAAHPGEDGVGVCKAGTQSCVLSSDSTSVQFGPCTGDIGPNTEACGPVQSDGVTTTPDSNCNGLNGDGDYLMLSAQCAPAATSFGQQSVHLFATPQRGTEAVYHCASGCPVGATGTFSYCSLSPCIPNATQTILGYAAINSLPNYVAVTIPAAACIYQGTYVTSYQIQIPQFTFYALPSP